ncbi:MAG: hypothetical protein KY445_12860, partial [Armatimonadetes bacterium]|nr:hypothetical protein [Armatimonadota bacterium]
MTKEIFTPANWIWTAHERPNQYVLFAKTVELQSAAPLQVQISASSHYELWLDGQFIARGPVHGDPRWCQYDEISFTPRAAGPLHIAVLVHHEDAYVHCLLPTRGGFIAAFRGDNLNVGTDESWKCLGLEMWSQNVSKRGWALGFGEDFNARLEPAGWDDKIFDFAEWENAVLIPDVANIWANYQKRMTPHLVRRLIEPVSFDAWQAPQSGAPDLGDVSAFCDEEPLHPVARGLSANWDVVNAQLADANALTFDLGREHVGFYLLDLEAPEGTIIEISGAELLRDDRPWIYRKGTSYSARYTTRAGRQQFTTFGWSGFRYLHLVFRGGAHDVKIHAAGCLERKVPLRALSHVEDFRAPDESLQNIFDLCRRTLEVGVQEHLVDCPTREQAQYWGDGVFIAQSLGKGFGEWRYLEWFLEC